MAPEETARRKKGAQLVTPGWFNLIRDPLATRLGIPPGDLELSPVNRRGKPGHAHPLFGGQRSRLLDELNAVLVAQLV